MNVTVTIVLLTFASLTFSLKTASQEFENVSKTSRTLTPEIQGALQAFETVLNGGKIPQQFTTDLTSLKVGLIDALSRFKLNPFTFFNAFIDAWRHSLPTLVPLGNYTLLQLALMLAIGGLAAGAAVIVAEAFYFKQVHEEEELLHHQLRRDYDLYYGKTSRQAFVTTKRPRVATLPPNRYKPQSLKRNQRRNQRKNKNAGAQLEYYKKQKAAEAAAAAKRRRGRRQVTFDRWSFNPQYPTVAPRPISTVKILAAAQNSFYEARPSLKQPFAKTRPNVPATAQPNENMLSLKFLKEFIQRQNLFGWRKYLPSIPSLWNWTDKSQRKHVPGRTPNPAPYPIPAPRDRISPAHDWKWTTKPNRKSYYNSNSVTKKTHA